MRDEALISMDWSSVWAPSVRRSLTVIAVTATPVPAASAPVAAPADLGAVASDLKDLLAGYRQIIVLLADEKTLTDAQRDAANTVGQALFHDNLARTAKINDALATLVASTDPARFDALDRPLAYIESDPDLFDADRLAFREVLQALREAVAREVLPGSQAPTV